MKALARPFVRVLRTPGALGFSLAALIARLPISMIGLGIVLLVSAQDGAYGRAGILTASYVIASAFFTPLGARYVDRWGQRLVVMIILAVHVPSLVLFVVGVGDQWPLIALIFIAAVAGATQPASGSLVRARWVHSLRGREGLQTAFAWESILDEVIFVTGPPLATILALLVAPAAPLIAATLLVFAGSLLLVSQRRSEPPAHPQNTGQPSAIKSPALIVLTFIMIALGSVFGSLEIVTVAAAAAAGQPGAAGVILALYAFGSLVGGVLFGARGYGDDRPIRTLVIAAALLALATLPFPFISSIIGLSIIAVFAGFIVAPVLILTNQLVEAVSAPGQLTEALAWVNTTGLGVGVAMSAAFAGSLVDASGVSAGYALTASAGLVTAVLAFSARGALTRAATRRS